MSMISSMFSSKSSQPAVPDVPPPPTKADASARAQDEAAKLRRGQGRQSTILTSGMGDQTQATTQKKELFGS